MQSIPSNTEVINPAQTSLILFFDGFCNLCDGTVQFVIKRDRQQKIKFLPLQSNLAQKVLAHESFDPTALDTVVCFHNGKVFTKSSAALEILQTLPGWSWVRIFWIVPPRLRDAVYDLVGRNRYRWFGRRETCMIVPPGRYADEIQFDSKNRSATEGKLL